MTELSDYQRMIEKPKLEQLNRMIKNQAAEIERLRAALRPFSNTVFYDNGDVTIDYTMAKYDDYVKAYFVLRRPAALTDAERKEK